MKKTVLFVIVAWSVCASVMANVRAEGYPLKVTERKLSNGLTVWINEDHFLPKVFGAVVVKAGAKDCPNTGIAHYFEHIMFKGTDKIGTVDYQAEKPWLDSIAARYDLLANTRDEAMRREIQNDINRLSVKAGEYAIPNEFTNLISLYGGTRLNAFTSFDETVYHNAFSPQFIAQWCELNSERLLTPEFRLFQGELETVYEEKNMYSDNMVGGAMEQAQKQLLKGTPYSYPVIGSTENLKNPRLSEMRAFYEKYYVAGNMGLILCGDVDADSIMPLLERTFGRVKPGTAPAAKPYALPVFDPSNVVHLKLPIPIMKAAGQAYLAPTDRDEDYVVFEIALSILTNGSDAGLLDSLVNENKMLMAGAGVMSLKDLSVMGFGYIPNIPFGSKRKAARQCLEQIERLKRGQFSEEVLAAQKLNYIRNKQRMLENLDERSSAMIAAMSHGLSWDAVLRQYQSVDKITKADIMRVASKYFSNSYARVEKKFGTYPKEKISQPNYKPVAPKHAGEKSAYAKALEQMPCSQMPPRLVDFDKDVATLPLSPLVHLYTTRNPYNDLFQLQLIFHKGSMEDRRLEAVSSYLDLIGVDSLSKHQFSKNLEALGARLNFIADSHSFSVVLSGFDRNFSSAMSLLNRFLTSAKPDKRKFKEMLKAYKIQRKTFFKDNGNIAGAAMEKVMFGSKSSFIDHLSLEALKQMDGQLLIDIFKELQSNEMSVVYSGNLGSEEVATCVRNNVNLDRINIPHHFVYRQLESIDTPTVYFFDNPDARQALIRTYSLLPAASTEEARAKMQLWGNYFGSGMSSILFQEIREFRSYAYSSSGSLYSLPLMTHPDAPLAYVTQLGTQADKSMLALGVLDSIFRNMPVRASNVAANRQAIIHSINNNYPDFRSIGRFVALRRVEGYRQDPSLKRSSILPLLGIDDVVSVYESQVKCAPRTVIVVGDKRKIDMRQLAQYGKMVELKKEDIYR
ncbi:MAG: insulinase family protein [Prevotella sp.]|nr:insulinase family protein [Prevotella sp.]